MQSKVSLDSAASGGRKVLIWSSSQLEKVWDNPAVQTVSVFAVFVFGLAVVQYATAGLIGTDGYYHIKVAYLMRTEGVKPVFDYLPLTILNEGAYYDHHYLYHLWLALFAWGNPLVDGGIGLTQGAKLASVLLPAATFTTLWHLLKKQRVIYPFFWSMGLLAVSEPFLYRMSMPRAQALSLLFLLLAVQWLLDRRYLWLGGLGFVFVWAYNAFPLLLVVAALYVGATWLTTRKLDWKALFWPAVGIGLGLLINPYFPENITFIVNHLVPKVGDWAVRVGNEWSAYRTETLLDNSGLTLLVFISAIFALGWREKRIDQRTLFSLSLVTLFGLMLFQSRRFIEYFPAFAVVFAALAWDPVIKEWLSNRARRFQAVLMGALILALLVPIRSTLTGAAGLAAGSKPDQRYAAASLWLYESAGPDIQIFQTDWDDFTRLFFYNSEATYTLGLDPTFMTLYDPDLFDLWVDITRGRVNHPGQLIRDKFGADYVFSDLNHRSFEESVKDDPFLIEIYRDEEAIIYKVDRSNETSGSVLN